MTTDRAFWLQIRRSLIQAVKARSEEEMRVALRRMIATIEREHLTGTTPPDQQAASLPDSLPFRRGPE